MYKSTFEAPIYIKISQILIGIVGLFYIGYIGQEIIVPLVFATILAILLNPVVEFLCRHGMNRILAIAIAVITTVILIVGIAFFVGSQFSLLSSSLPQLKTKFTTLFQDAEHWFMHTFNVSKGKMDASVKKASSDEMSSVGQMAKTTLGTIGGTLMMLVLLPVYVFLILFYKPLLLGFMARLFQQDKHEVVGEVLAQAKTLIQSYLVGLMIEGALVATLNSVALLIIGVDYAILLGIIGAIVNVIPYIGGLVAIVLPMLMAFATKSTLSALYVMVAYVFIQFIDNHYFIPRIVASKVKLNALVSIVVVLIGNAFWGVSGMFLSIPLTAIIKVIFDHVPGLRAFGFLLGDEQQIKHKPAEKFRAILQKKNEDEKDAKNETKSEKKT
jgi:predicted PurR-regulated permease PerM